MMNLLVTWQRHIGQSLTDSGENYSVKCDTMEAVNAIIDKELRQMQAQATAEDTPYVLYFEGFTHGVLQQYECFILTPEA